VEYRRLGKADLKVSALGFGGAPQGIPNYLSPDDRDSERFRAASTPKP
jgi:aryl-alcohol dehydrogenase-like predicted oxidoreductase